MEADLWCQTLIYTAVCILMVCECDRFVFVHEGRCLSWHVDTRVNNIYSLLYCTGIQEDWLSLTENSLRAEDILGFVACWPNLLKLSCHVHPINEMDTLNLDFVDFDPCEIGSYLPEVIEIECLFKTQW